MYRVVIMNKVATAYPCFSTPERAWNYIMDELEEEREEFEDAGMWFDFDHAMSFYGVVFVD